MSLVRPFLRHSTQALVGRLEWFAHSGVNLLFPPGCLLCDTLFDETSIAQTFIPYCESCQLELVSPYKPACSRCGAGFAREPDRETKEENREASVPCRRCRDRKLAFDHVIRLAGYEGRIREVVLQMKRAAGQNLAVGIGKLLWSKWGDQLASFRPEVVVPIASHWRRRMVRGPDSAERIAEILAGKLEIPHVPGLLVRRRNTLPQFNLSPDQRFKNVRGAFALSKAYVLQAKRVLLVDDILTTGATCHEAARTLKRHGAESVTVAVAARAIGD